MKSKMVMIGLVAVVLLTGRLAIAQEHEPMPPPDDPERAIELQNQQLDLEQRRAEMNFENEMRKLQLAQKRMELDGRQQMGPGPAMGPCSDKGCYLAMKPGPGKQGWKGRHAGMKHCAAFMLFCLVIHILLSIWVYQDIRRRNAGSGVWIVITLLTGLLGALVYAVVRLGDKPA